MDRNSQLVAVAFARMQERHGLRFVPRHKILQAGDTALVALPLEDGGQRPGQHAHPPERPQRPMCCAGSGFEAEAPLDRVVVLEIDLEAVLRYVDPVVLRFPDVCR